MTDNSLNRRGFLSLAAGGAGASVMFSTTSRTGAEDEPGRLPFQRNLPVHRPYDLVVCGGGPSGIAAALAARRSGLSVLLVEGQGQLGGTGISGLVSHWLGGRTSDCERWVVGGVFRSLAQEAAQRGIALIPVPDPEKKYQPHGWYKGQLAAGIPFDPFAMAAFLDRKMEQAGVDVLLLTQVVDVNVDGQKISHVILFNKSGLSAVPARAVVDATGDADVAARSGCPVVKGDEEGLMTPTSLIFHVDNVDQDTLDSYIHEHDSPRFREMIAELREAGQWTFPYEIFISVQLVEKGTMMINTIRLLGIDGTDGESKTEGMIRGREDTEQLLAVMRKHIPGFANAHLKAVATSLGVRETRRIVGSYVLTVDDLRKGEPFDDIIGYSAYGWDLPDPKRPSYNPSHGKRPEAAGIPYRIMVPAGMENLVCPGRAVSVERFVLGPLRVMAPCMAMGEAAGEAAVQVVRDQLAFDAVNVTELRGQLRTNGAIVDWS